MVKRLTIEFLHEAWLILYGCPPPSRWKTTRTSDPSIVHHWGPASASVGSCGVVNLLTDYYNEELLIHKVNQRNTIHIIKYCTNIHAWSSELRIWHIMFAYYKKYLCRIINTCPWSTSTPAHIWHEAICKNMADAADVAGATGVLLPFLGILT